MALFYLNLVFLVWRVSHRMLFTTWIYDWRHGLVSVIRLIVANLVNFLAAARAIRIYVRHRMTGKVLVWDKTAHSYPVKLRQVVAPPPREATA